MPTDEECFEEIMELLAAGWRFDGNSFERDQSYRLRVSRGTEVKIFCTEKPFPKIVDAAGQIMS